VIDRVRCSRCGDLIGVYEPMVMLADGAPPRLSALFLEPDLAGEGAVLLHRGCHTGPVVGPDLETDPQPTASPG
jgi:hypothetical protein